MIDMLTELSIAVVEIWLTKWQYIIWNSKGSWMFSNTLIIMLSENPKAVVGIYTC